jgi:hypothetical protein
LKRNSIETHSQRDKIIKVYTKVQWFEFFSHFSNANPLMVAYEP